MINQRAALEGEWSVWTVETTVPKEMGVLEGDYVLFRVGPDAQHRARKNGSDGAGRRLVVLIRDLGDHGSGAVVVRARWDTTLAARASASESGL